ncbi:MAG: glycosyltransferase [Bryobacteraceae bacterium]
MLRALTVRGPFRGPTGYDHHVREFVRELHTQGVAVELQDLPAWSPAKLPGHMRDPWFDSLNQPCGAETVLHFCMPHQVIRYPGKVNTNFTMFEASRVHPNWVKANRQHDSVILPTESSKRAWVDSGFPEHRLRLCPFGVNTALFSGEASPLHLEGATAEDHGVRFLNVSEFNSRKNLMGLLEAWILATSRQDDAILIVKLGCYKSAARQRFADQIDLLEQRLNKRLAEAAPIRLVHDFFPDSEMPRLYAAATHYISMSHGEGWDQPMMEAAASGLKLIAPAHSAYLAYLNSSIASLIPAREAPVLIEGDAATAELFKDAHWWQPDRDSAIQFIRDAIEGRDRDKPSPRGQIVHDFTWTQATRRLIEILDEVQSLKAQPIKAVLSSLLARRSDSIEPVEQTHSEPGSSSEPDRT